MDGTVGRGTAPSGASTGEFEALELRDGQADRYLGKGVTKAVENINTIIDETLTGMDASDIYAIDAAMIQADGKKTNQNWEQMQFLRYRLPAVEQHVFLWIFHYIVSLEVSMETVFRFR